jgi:hypothetical protein
MSQVLRIRHPFSTLTRLTLFALLVNALAFASEFVMIGQIDFEIAIVVGCLAIGCLLIATGWRWTPAIGAFLAGAILIGNPFLVYNLSQPFPSGFLLAAVTQALSAMVVVVAGLGAVFQNYRKGFK